MPYLRRAGLALCLLAPAITAGGHEGESHESHKPPPSDTAAPGWSDALPFDLPEAGSYKLPVLGRAGDGRVVDAGRGVDTTLHDLFDGRYVVLSFIYRSCSDANGCPLATYVLSRTRERLRAEGKADDVRFLSLSFDPEHDTPEVMADYGEAFAGDASDWRFLTTRDKSQLRPILEEYGQTITQEIDAGGETTGGIAHLLRVYLIDKDKRIRNIYSTGFLHPDTLVNDLRTLRQQAGGKTAVTKAAAENTALPAAGDVKQGYERKDYRTRSQSLEQRHGRHADLMAYLDNPPLGLPPIPVPADNPITREKAALGRLLFFDRRLSHNNTIACANCHIPEQGFTSQEIATAVGIEGQTVRRNAPTIYNSAYLTRLFHDGRETSLEHQIWGPLLAGNEMGNPAVGYVLEQVRDIPGYRERFKQIFGDRGIDMETLGMALAAYQRLLVSGNSPFDRWYYGGDESAVSKKAKQGFKLFTGKAQCSACHSVGKEHALFTDNRMHNTGLGYAHSMGKADNGKLQVAPGTYIDIVPNAAEGAAETPPNDLGLYEITEDPDDRWKYRTPTLRNVALTAPYMHNGALATLEDVVRFYNAGGIKNPLLDPLVVPLGLSETEIDQLVAFLNSLTGSNVATLVADAHATPMGNVRNIDK